MAFNKLAARSSVTTSRRQELGRRNRSDSSMPPPPGCRSPHTLPRCRRPRISLCTVWPQTMQKALLGQITPDDMMQIFDKHYFG